MTFTAPVRFSRNWWLTILVTTMVIGVVAFVVLRYRAGLDLEELLIYWIAFTFGGDVITALSMEAVAPTRVAIGPGERRFARDDLTELAVVVSDFDELGLGHVRVRGETWRAKRIKDDGVSLNAGVHVRVVDREGLTLLVSAHVS